MEELKQLYILLLTNSTGGISMSKETNLHIYSQDGGLIVGNIRTLQEAREAASDWASKNIGKSANIFSLYESHICEVAPLKVVKAKEIE